MVRTEGTLGPGVDEDGVEGVTSALVEDLRGPV